jgi:ATP-dependent DNA helicase RecG
MSRQPNDLGDRSVTEDEECIALVDDLRHCEGEGTWFEFKVNNAAPAEIGEYLSALSNAAALADRACGYLVWGVDDSSHEVVGTTFNPNTTKKGNEPLENWLARGLDPSTHFRFRRWTQDGHDMALLEVQRATHRPVNFRGKEVIRIGSARQELRRHPEIERRLWKVFDQTPFEDLLAAEHLSSTDVLRLLDYSSYFGRLLKSLPETQDGIVQALLAAKFLCREPGNRWAVTNLGALAIANDLTAFAGLGRKALRIVTFDGNDRTAPAREEEWTRGYASGWDDLLRLVRAILPRREVMVEGTRKEVVAYPDEMIREMIANALIHQDLFESGVSPIVAIFRDRIEISNPGQPLVPVTRFLDFEPKSRNEALARFMRLAHICEERGTGVDKAVSAAEEYEMPAPMFDAPGASTRVVLLTHRPFKNMTRDEQLNACYLHACLLHLKGERMTNTSLRRRLGLPEAQVSPVSRLIQVALQADLIRVYDPLSGRKMVSYVPAWA